MSLFLDQKYLSLISNRLPLFKRKSERLYNCRCVICGDSAKNKNKARGYFFEYKAELRYKCHNCDASLSFGTFLKKTDTLLHSQYLMERYSEGASRTSNTISFTFEEPIFKSKEDRLIDKLLDRLDSLSEDNEAVRYCESRSIPRSRYHQLYYIDDIRKISQLNSKYVESIKGSEPRLVLPFYDEHGQLTGVTCRGLRDEALRYITVKIKEDAALIFGINDIDSSKTIYVVEGPIDSLFLDNSIAVAGTSLNKVAFLETPTSNIVYIYDNQPRNVELCKIIERSIDQGKSVVIWPQNMIEKDINAMVLAGKNITKLIKENTVSGLVAKAKFYSWKRV